jgi:hypothetical protein
MPLPNLPPPEPPKPPKPPFDAPKWAMVLLAVMVCTPCLLVLIITARCVVSLDPVCWDKPWPTLFRDWLLEVVPVLVAVIMTGRTRGPLE